MKKLSVLLSILLLLSSCSNSANEEFDSSGDHISQSFSEDEIDVIQKNSGLSNFSNSVNLKCSTPGKMCYIEETDTLFYSDSHGLFQKNGDNIITLLDKPVFSINLANGILYFIIPEGDDGEGPYGKAYCMDLKDGSTKCIIDDNISSMSVYKDKIFYRKTAVTEREDGMILVATGFYKCALSGENTEQIQDFFFLFDNDLSVSASDDSIKVKDLQNDTVNAVADEPDMVSNLSIYKNNIYYIRTNRTSLSTSAVKIDLSDNSLTEYSAGSAYFEDYGFIDDKLCLYCIGEGFYVLENGDPEKYECKENYNSIYSCCGKMYGSKSDGDLYELSLKNDNGKKSIAETKLGDN